MKKILAGVMLVLVLGAVVFLTLDRAKADAKPADPETTEAEMPTGFPSGEVQMPFLFHDGVLYYYNGRHMTDKPDPNWKSVGTVTAEDNIKLPQEEGTASHIAVGTQLFRKDGEDIVWFQWSEYYYGLVPYQAEEELTDPASTEVQTPTGFPAGEVQMPFLFHDGVLYYYNGRHMTDKPDPNWKSVGTVTAENNIDLPQEEGTASHIAVGTQLFRKDGEDIVWFQWSEYYYGLVPYPFNDNPNG